MIEKDAKKFASKFEEDVWTGLTDFPKHLPSMYIYDKKGDKLFQDIMSMPSYYLTDCEFEILKKHKTSIAKHFGSQDGFDLIELGVGDGKKTKILLSHLMEKGFAFDYVPIDISKHILEGLKEALERELPGLLVRAKQGAYFEVLDRLAEYNERKKVILVLGSNIGNLLHPQAIKFMRHIQQAMQKGDMLFMGFDQKKHPHTIWKAYNDPEGITSAFNKNLLYRINKELGGDFKPKKFIHWETYDPETGTAKSYLISSEQQQVQVKKIGLTLHFKKWESLHMEISQKYDDDVVEWLAGKAGLQIRESFADDRAYFKNYIFVRK